MKCLKKLFRMQRKKQQEEMEVPPPTTEEQMEVNPNPVEVNPDRLQVPAGQAGPSTNGVSEAPKSPTKNFKYFWVEKVDNQYAKPTHNARNISETDLQLGIGVPRKRKKIESQHLIK